MGAQNIKKKRIACSTNEPSPNLPGLILFTPQPTLIRVFQSPRPSLISTTNYQLPNTNQANEFFQYTETNSPHSRFIQTFVSFNKLLNVIGKSRNIEFFWELLHEMGRRRLVNDKTFRIGL